MPCPVTGLFQQGNIMTDIQTMFSDPQAVAKYTEGPPRFVSGYNAMLSMAAILLASVRPRRRRCSSSARAAAWS